MSFTAVDRYLNGLYAPPQPGFASELPPHDVTPTQGKLEILALVALVSDTLF